MPQAFGGKGMMPSLNDRENRQTFASQEHQDSILLKGKIIENGIDSDSDSSPQDLNKEYKSKTAYVSKK